MGLSIQENVDSFLENVMPKAGQNLDIHSFPILKNWGNLHCNFG